MVAVELITGQRAWELNIAGISTPWVAGDWVFVVTDRAQLLAVSRANGQVRWMTQLQRYRSSQDERSGPVFWRGPILAGGNLVLASSMGQILLVNPADGTVRQSMRHMASISLPPVVANGTMYILDDNGMLTAYK
jgi:outer membrane protein assembly factor BamB